MRCTAVVFAARSSTSSRSDPSACASASGSALRPSTRMNAATPNDAPFSSASGHPPSGKSATRSEASKHDNGGRRFAGFTSERAALFSAPSRRLSETTRRFGTQTGAVCRESWETGATGLEPATSGVTGQIGVADLNDDGSGTALFIRFLGRVLGRFR